MGEKFARPILRPGHEFEWYEGAEDPAEYYSVARSTAWALLERVRTSSARETIAQDIVERMLVADTHGGLGDIAQLWSRASARSLPGALWRLYLVRAVVRNDPEGTSYTYQLGVDALSTIDPVVAGAVTPTGPTEISELCDRILRGVFDGDLAIACERAAAFASVMRTGYVVLAQGAEGSDPERAQGLTTRAARYAQFADDFRAVAKLWRSNSLD
ncbi:DNA-directed RNA polymerase subunit beta [Lysinibacter sp. HNR]|uniref:DNA-directed RNA polymerase subunit beta n=1 Tax=Lysinibacter sp. HNR TaxID=3031408 RepID=UPI002435511E|nr:DNA-directed RNA polymerase subunit beta [Lysinibacter sp. HNR]WGD38109.1 DNA-directed RNA polymerase subunit beta [Lysinibacter sp. HNR]